MNKLILPDLPFGAKAIEICGHILSFSANGKFTYINKKTPGHHWTVHFGLKSGILDIHKTTRGSDGASNHETLIAIPHSAIQEFIQEQMSEIEASTLAMVRELDEETLKKQNLILTRSLNRPFLEEYSEKRKGKLQINPDGAHSLVAGFELLTYSPKEPSEQTFLIWRRSAGDSSLVGVGFYAAKAPESAPRAYWFKALDVFRLINRIKHAFREVVQRREIPPEEYARRFSGPQPEDLGNLKAQGESNN